MKNFVKIGNDYFNTDTIRRISPFFKEKEIVEKGQLKRTNEFFPACLIFYTGEDSPRTVILKKDVYPSDDLASEKADCIISEFLK